MSLGLCVERANYSDILRQQLRTLKRHLVSSATMTVLARRLKKPNSRA